MKTILITGSSSGIGKTTVEFFSKKGWNVVATMRDPKNAKTFNWEKNVLVLSLDVTQPKTIHQARLSAEKLFGQIDVIVNNAGYGLFGPLETASEEEIQKQFDTNFFGIVNIIKEFLPRMRERNSGVIINISSILGKFSTLDIGYYSASKHALEALSESLSYQLRKTNIFVKIIEPSATQSNFLKNKIIPQSRDQFYAKALKEVRELTQWKGSSTETVAKKIYEAATDKNKKLRYPAGRYSSTILFFRKILPDKIFLWFVNR